MYGSRFDGRVPSWIGYSICFFLITSLSFGIAYPWAKCMMLSWETRHKVIDGRRLIFDGTGAQLFGSYIIWWFFTVITMGIYGFWLRVKVLQWITKHTHFADADSTGYTGTGTMIQIEHTVEYERTYYSKPTNVKDDDSKPTNVEDEEESASS